MAITARYLFFFGLSFFPILQYMRTERLESLFPAQYLIDWFAITPSGFSARLIPFDTISLRYKIVSSMSFPVTYILFRPDVPADARDF